MRILRAVRRAADIMRGQSASQRRRPAMTTSTARRAFLAAGGALVVAFAIAPRPARRCSAGAQRGAAGDGAAAARQPKTQPLLDAWIRIDADGAHHGLHRQGRARPGHQDRADPGRGRGAGGRAAARSRSSRPTPRARANEGYTAGSHSMQDSGTAIRHAAAQVRALLLATRGRRGSASPADSCASTTAHRRPTAASASATASWSPSADAARRGRAAERRCATRRRTRSSAGRSPRVDIPAKVTRRRGLRAGPAPAGHGAWARRAAAGAAARWRASTRPRVERLPGVLKVVRDGRFLGVVAEREYAGRASRMRALADAARWDERPTLPARRRDPDPTTHARRAGARTTSSSTGQRRAARRAGAHASRRPIAAPTRCTARSARPARSRSSPTAATPSGRTRRASSRCARRSPRCSACRRRAVRCIHVEGSGCYGHNGADDVAADAALLARALPGRPVRVQWMREDEHAWEPLRPADDRRPSRATLDADGAIVDWQLRGLEQHPFDAARRAPATCSPARAARARRSRRRRRSRCRSRKAAATATRSRSTRCRTRASSTTSCPTCRSACRRCARSAPT